MEAPEEKGEISLYFHYPYCLRKCYYCDFISIPRSYIQEHLEKSFLASLEKHGSFWKEKEITTIFFGGGTPSLAPMSFFESLINNIGISKTKEISVEVNPATINEDKLKGIRDLGVNRISIGVQALDDESLKVLGRMHSEKEALTCIESTAKHFDNFSLDFIYARPGQNAKNWEKELKRILGIGAPHLSLYQLAIENGWDVEVPDDDEAAAMMDINHTLTAEQYNHYEISNYAREGYQCLHNLVYWHMDDYLGIGPSAHSRIGNKAIIQDDNIQNWLKNQRFYEEKLSEKERVQEQILMGLRLAEGITINEKTLAFINTKASRKLTEAGLLLKEQNRLKPTLQGMKMLDYILKEILT